MTPLEDAGAPKERPYGVSGLGAKIEPMVGPCLVDLKRTRVVLTGSVLADDLDEWRLDPGSSRRWSVQRAPGTTRSCNLIG